MPKQMLRKYFGSYQGLIAVILLLSVATFITLIITERHVEDMQLLGRTLLFFLIGIVLTALILLLRIFIRSKSLMIENNKYQEKLIKANRLYFFTSQVNQMIIKTTDEKILFKEACRIAIETGKFKMAWVGIIDEKTKIVSPVMHDGFDMDYLSTIKIIADSAAPEGRGPSATAILTKGYAVSNDIATDEKMSLWRTEALKRNYYSSIALPITKLGKVIGVFTLYADTKNYFDASEIALLEETAGNISFALDIFEKERQRKKAEQALSESEKRYQTLTESSPVGIFHTDETGYTTYVNPQWTKISGMSFEEALGNGWLNGVHEEDRSGLEKRWQQATKGKKLSTTEYRFKRSDGSIAWVLGQAIPETNSLNEIVGYIGTITDITSQKISEHEIAQALDLSSAIINSLPGIFYLYDEKGKFLRWNKNFETVSGYSIEEIKNLHPLDLFDVDEKGLLAEKISNTFKYGQDNVEANLLLKDRKKIPYYFTGKLIEYENIPCLMGVGIDITERVEAQEKIKETSEELRQLAVHLQTIREVERKRIGREIHDELGQQLTAIKMDVAWIDKKIPEESATLKTKIKNIIALLDGSNKSIRRILSELRPGILEDHDLLEAMEWLGNQFTTNTGIPVIFNKPEKTIKTPQLIANCIFRVYQEALTNITRYAKAKKVSTIIRIDNNNIIFTIADDGTGFDIAGIKNKKSFGLLGMKERVHSLNGKFELISSPGSGTKITVSLPL